MREFDLKSVTAKHVKINREIWKINREIWGQNSLKNGIDIRGSKVRNS